MGGVGSGRLEAGDGEGGTSAANSLSNSGRKRLRGYDLGMLCVLIGGVLRDSRVCVGGGAGDVYYATFFL